MCPRMFATPVCGNRWWIVVALLACLAPLMAGCYGPFPLTKEVHQFNRDVSDNEIARSIVKQMGDPVTIRRGVLPYREGEIWRLVGDNTRARTILRWEPQVSLEEGIRRTIAHMSGPSTRRSLGRGET